MIPPKQINRIETKIDAIRDVVLRILSSKNITQEDKKEIERIAKDLENSQMYV